MDYLMKMQPKNGYEKRAVARFNQLAAELDSDRAEYLDERYQAWQKTGSSAVIAWSQWEHDLALADYERASEIVVKEFDELTPRRAYELFPDLPGSINDYWNYLRDVPFWEHP